MMDQFRYINLGGNNIYFGRKNSANIPQIASTISSLWSQHFTFYFRRKNSANIPKQPPQYRRFGRKAHQIIGKKNKYETPPKKLVKSPGHSLYGTLRGGFDQVQRGSRAQPPAPPDHRQPAPRAPGVRPDLQEAREGAPGKAVQVDIRLTLG